MRLFTLLCLACAGFLTAQLINTLLLGQLPVPNFSPSPPPETIAAQHGSTEAFKDRNVFGASRDEIRPSPPPPASLTECSPSQSGDTLIATMLSEPGSTAFVSRGKDYASYRVGDELSDGRRVTSIDRRSIKLLHQGRCETLSLSRARPSKTPRAPRTQKSRFEITKKSEREFAISSETIAKVLSEPGDAIRDARVQPILRGAKRGLKLRTVRRGGLYDQLGLSRGDLLTRINGHELDRVDRLMEIYLKLKDVKSLTLDLERRGVKKTINYSIE